MRERAFAREAVGDKDHFVVTGPEAGADWASVSECPQTGKGQVPQ
jgi:hypothetical protein